MGRRSGCGGAIVIVVLGAVLLSVLLPPAAGALVGLGLEAAGLRGEGLVVRVEANPPLRLLTGQADRVVVEGRTIHWDGLTAGTLRLTLDAVDLVGRQAGSVDGLLEAVAIAAGPTGSLAAERVEIAGPGRGPTARLRIAPSEAAHLLQVLAGGVGLAEARVALAPPDRVEVEVAGRRLAARIVVLEGAVVVEGADLPRLVVLSAGAMVGFEVRSVAVASDGGLVVQGQLDPGRLGLAG